MSKRSAVNHARRQAITTILPACALACLGGSRASAMLQSNPTQEATHRFDAELERTLTNRQFIDIRYRDVISLAKALEKNMGKENAIAFLKKVRTEEMLERGKAQASEFPDDSLDSYVDQFRTRYKNTLTMEIIQDSKKAFELKITECLWADTFRRAGAGEIGYAWICSGDYAWARAFNPRIRLVRDKTLMQGHAYCNHRYIWEGIAAT
jgi:hypothetical protein